MLVRGVETSGREDRFRLGKYIITILKITDNTIHIQKFPFLFFSSSSNCSFAAISNSSVLLLQQVTEMEDSFFKLRHSFSRTKGFGRPQIGGFSYRLPAACCRWYPFLIGLGWRGPITRSKNIWANSYGPKLHWMRAIWEFKKM